MTFDEAFERLLGHEGGYVDDPRDPGGETRWGVSKRSYPNEDIRNLTKERAKAIYRRDFWDRVRADEIPAPLRFDVFDAAVNSGPGQSVKWLQASVGATADGALGPVTMAAIARTDPLAASARFNGRRLMFMTTLKTWPTFGRGWARRIAANLIAAEDAPADPPAIAGPLVERVASLETRMDAVERRIIGDGK